jgi:hypothetical protein
MATHPTLLHTVLDTTQVLDRSDDEVEPLYVFAVPSGHPFCIFLA